MDPWFGAQIKNSHLFPWGLGLAPKALYWGLGHLKKVLCEAICDDCTFTSKCRQLKFKKNFPDIMARAIGQCTARERCSGGSGCRSLPPGNGD